MSEEQQLRTVKKMIKAGMYDEARAALLTINHPLADQWLEKLNKISPPKYQMAGRNEQAIRKSQAKSKNKPKPMPKDDFAPDYEDDYNYPPYQAESTSKGTMVIIIAVLIGIGALLIGGAVMLTQGGFVEPAITTDETGCGAQEWINAIDGSFNELYRYNLWEMLFFSTDDGLLKIDEDLRANQIKELNTRLTRIEKTTAPDCVVTIREKIIEAYKSQIRATEILQPDNPLSAFGLFGKTFNLMKESATELITLGAQFRRIDSEAINQIVEPKCPAFEYVTRTMYIDNQFVVMALVDPDIKDLQSFYSFINDLAQQYYRVKDDPNVPPCLWDVRNHFVEAIDAIKSLYEAALAGDFNGMEVHLQRYNASLDLFYTQIEKLGLDPTQFGSQVVIREDTN